MLPMSVRRQVREQWRVGSDCVTSRHMRHELSNFRCWRCLRRAGSLPHGRFRRTRSHPPTPSMNAGGLTSREARLRLARFGANAMPDTSAASVARGAGQILGAGALDAGGRVVLELALGKYVEAAVIAGLLLFNAIIGLVQEGRAQHTLAALNSRLAMTASVRRDGAWTTFPPRNSSPGT